MTTEEPTVKKRGRKAKTPEEIAAFKNPLGEKKTRAKRKPAYIDKERLYELVKSYQETGVYSRELHQMFEKMCDKIGSTFKYTEVNSSYKDDCRQFALMKAWIYAKKFNLDFKEKVFSYMTQVIITSMAFQWNKIFSKARKKTIYYSSID